MADCGSSSVDDDTMKTVFRGYPSLLCVSSGVVSKTWQNKHCCLDNQRAKIKTAHIPYLLCQVQYLLMNLVLDSRLVVDDCLGRRTKRLKDEMNGDR